MSFSFTGSQVRLLGRVDLQGGLADVYVDGVKPLVGIDYWNPSPRHQQVLYYRNGLSDGEHTLKIVARGNGNPRSSGANVYVDSIQWSTASGSAGNAEGGGPTDTQRMVLGYTARKDYTDRAGNTWRPATEVVTPLRVLADSVVKTWWTAACPDTIADTRDPELYRYGLHAREFVVNVTVGPGKYHVRLRFAATHRLDFRRNCVTVLINGEKAVAKMDVAATAGGPSKAVDLVFNDISPRNGVIDIRFVGGDVANGVEGEAFAQAIEVGPGDGGSGANPICVGENLLNNPGFEEGVPDSKVMSSGEGGGHGWSYRMEGQGRGCVSAESSWADKPVLGAPEPCSENEAVRVYSEGDAVTAIYQDAPVSPNSKYTASVFVRARDLDGRGFGQTPGDSVGVRVVEMDANGKVVADHPKAEVTKACPYTYLSTTFTTAANTAKVRFMLETKMGCDRTHGSVTYDGCALDGPPMACILTGKVVHKGKALPGAQVTIGDKAGTTDAEGAYKVAGVPCVRRPLQVRVSKTGCYPEEKWVAMASGVNTANFELIGPPANNLLVNPGFEDGVSQYLRGGPLEGHGWKYVTVPGNSVIYPESEYTQHRSLGCPEFHSGKEAVRVSSTNGNDRISLYQDVPVAPDAYYVASVFVRTRDIIQGEGFGKGKSDSAGLHMQELDAEGKVVADHPKAEVNRMTNYRCVWLAFTTTPATRKVRFSLETVIACKWVQGNVTYDDCALEGPAASAPQ